MRRLFPLLILFSALCSSCKNPELESLRESLSQEYTQPDAVGANTSLLAAQYRDAELKANAYYVQELQDIVESGFERQIEAFDKNELGFFAGYKYMFQYVTLSKQARTDLWKVKASKYFNTSSSVDQDVHDCFGRYADRIEGLRKRFSDGIPPGQAKPVIDLPAQDVTVEQLTAHSRNNLFIEFGVDIAVKLFIFAVIALLSLVGIIWTKGYSFVAFLLSLLISVWLSMANDKKMLNSLREQERVAAVDYGRIRADLDANTFDFYEAYCK